MVRDEGFLVRLRMLRFFSGFSNFNIFVSFVGKNRVWVILVFYVSDSYYRFMMSFLKDDVYCELAERYI